ncbi:cellulose biosynthesis protein BcsE [Enterobacter cancerogenus]|uniref:cellulose biosynthesis protein BcsE n=1 Tax=Enterobacter cancerogenus TaxID=69218 RepID=UPI00053783B9|nr:cellulose biosynthesis protein BcsE [Enterobacter cancerogenus]KGT89005.1 cellulose biosynthesis protein [Enterobacter cancerogenus]
MKNRYALGLQQVQQELVTLQNPGFYWITSQRQEDARVLLRQVVSHQQAATLVSSDEKPQSLLTPDPLTGPARIPLFSLPANKTGLQHLENDFARVLNSRSGLVLFYSNAAQWSKLSEDELTLWVKRMRRLLIKKQITLLLITSGASIIHLRNHLQRYFRQLDGVAHLEFQQDSWQYRINWWYSADKLLADRAIRLSCNDNQFIAINDVEQTTPLSLNDENQFLAQEGVLEGAPPLSSQWQLFSDNESVFSRAQQANAATVIFSLAHNQDINALAKMVHSLRRSRGNALKIVVREISTSLRYSDERLLLACGVNAIVPGAQTLSRFLTTLEGIQGQQFTRHVPANLPALMQALQPLQQKGYLQLEPFCSAVQQLMSNTLLPENDKGLMVALRPVPQLKPEQILTLCKPRRFGDLVTLINDRIYLFLSSCRFNDLDIALKSIFSLPHDELFSNRVVWFEDNQILSEVHKIRQLTPVAQREVPMAPIEAPRANKVSASDLRGAQTPQPIVLNLDGDRR